MKELSVLRDANGRFGATFTFRQHTTATRSFREEAATQYVARCFLVPCPKFVALVAAGAGGDFRVPPLLPPQQQADASPHLPSRRLLRHLFDGRGIITSSGGLKFKSRSTMMD